MRPKIPRPPIIASLSAYRAGWLKGDVAAGVAIAAVGLPSAIAYPAIAGLPPETGLYASIAPLVGYALFGPSLRLVVGPDAGTMTVLAAVLAGAAAASPEAAADPVAIAALLALLVGALCLVARALRLGVLASFLSRPILIGFFAGISLSILVGQLGRMTGVAIEADGLFAPVLELARKAAEIHWPSLILAAGMFVLLQVARAWRWPVPGPVIVVVLAVALSALFDFEGLGIRVVGDIPAGLPEPGVPDLQGLPFDVLLLGAAAIFLVSFGSGIVTARSFGAQAGYVVESNRELGGFAAANIAAGLFAAFPVTASDSRTAVNLMVGGRTQVASLVAAAALTAVLLFLGEALRVLPIPALGAILAATALSLIDVAALRRIWQVSRMDFAFAMIAMAGPIGLGVLNGVVIAIGATLLYLLRRSMAPRDALIGRVAGRDGFYKLHREPKARAVPGLAIWRIQGSLVFFNTEHVQQRLRTVLDDLPAGTRWFVLDASAMPHVDSTAAAMLDEVVTELAARRLVFAIAELHADARALLERAGVIDRIGADMVFDDLDDALRAFREADTHGTTPA